MQRHATKSRLSYLRRHGLVDGSPPGMVSNAFVFCPFLHRRSLPDVLLGLGIRDNPLVGRRPAGLLARVGSQSTGRRDARARLVHQSILVESRDRGVGDLRRVSNDPLEREGGATEKTTPHVQWQHGRSQCEPSRGAPPLDSLLVRVTAVAARLNRTVWHTKLGVIMMRPAEVVVLATSRDDDERRDAVFDLLDTAGVEAGLVDGRSH